MKISYNWIKEFLPIELDPGKVSQLLTDCGLEVEGVSHFQSVQGGLEGLVVGEVLEKQKHPDADRLNLTKVNIGNGEPLSIVCGAPNVEAGQKVVVATVGTTLYPLNGDGFQIKKSKIRGAVSEGMICAEDEIGIGESHDGIMVLDESVEVGLKASDYFKIENDVVFEIGLTPNRADAMSHFGVARDLAAVLHTHKIDNTSLKKLEDITLTNCLQDEPIQIEVLNTEACPRYCGVTIKNVQVKPSPDWLQNKLKAIGLNPINNIVDITNYVLHELGQPLHAFDADKIAGRKVMVKNLPNNTKFVGLDEKEYKLSADDLMICDEKGGMCIAGVFGGIDSGVTASTKNIFLESAYFHPVAVRKTAKRHGLNTDASFRFERGIDPEITVLALKRAASLIEEIANGKVASQITDIASKKMEGAEVFLSFNYCYKLIGKELDKQLLIDILSELDIQVVQQTDEGLALKVPAYRNDVTRPVDVVEEILRTYGYNNVEVPSKLQTSLSYSSKPDNEKLQNSISDLLAANGFNEILCNSLVSKNKVDGKTAVDIVNPLSIELNSMRQNMYLGALESAAFNINRKANSIKFFEFGRGYQKTDDGYQETDLLGICLAGNKKDESWREQIQTTDFYTLKSAIDAILERLGLQEGRVQVSDEVSDKLVYGISYLINGKVLAEFGEASTSLCEEFDIDIPVFLGQINWGMLKKAVAKNRIKYKPVSKFPEVRRDLSLLLDINTSFASLKTSALKTERKLLKSVSVFDVYQGKNLPEGKKSYALKFILQDENKTLNDKEIDKVMKKIQMNLEQEFNAQLR